MLAQPPPPGGSSGARSSPKAWSALAARARRVLEVAGTDLTWRASNDLPPVTCVLLNWNGWRDTLECLACLERLDYPPLSVLVVDNGSTDGSAARIREAHPDIPVIDSGGNLGFAAGNNIGIRAALEQGADYVWILNNDTLPRPDALRALVLRAEADPELGAVGSVLPYADNPARIQAWGGGRISFWTGRVIHARGPVDEKWFEFLTAASVLVRREALESSGLFDESFFLYWEDVDLGYRLRKGGWKLGMAPGSVVLHREHGSTGRNYRVLDRYGVASSILFMRKHAPVPWVSIPLALALKIAKRILTLRFARAAAIVGGIGDYRRRQQELAEREAAPSSPPASPVTGARG